MARPDILDDSSYQEWFWDLVRRCLVELYAWDAATASERVEQLSTDLASTDRATRLMTFHAEPVHVAAEMAGKKITPTRIRQYEKLRSDATETAGKKRAQLDGLTTEDIDELNELLKQWNKRQSQANRDKLARSYAKFSSQSSRHADDLDAFLEFVETQETLEA